MGTRVAAKDRPKGRSKAPAEDTAAFGAIAERFRRAGALDQAVSLCRDGLKKFPDHVSARVTLGWALMDLGKYNEARIELEQVMRRAPDNLAAIRGLAELHDRFEHTLNLSMDGPGQWPPPLEDGATDAGPDLVALDSVSEPALEQFEAASSAIDDVLANRPADAADVDLPLWTPAAEPEIAQATAAADPHAPEPVTYATEPTTGGVGMGSMRDPFADSTPVVAPAASVEAEEDLGVTDPALAALIAEAESLDAVVNLEMAASETFGLASDEVDAPIELAAESVAVPDVSESAPIELGHVGVEESEPIAAVALDPVVETMVSEPEAEVPEPMAQVAEAVPEVAEPAAEVAAAVLDVPDPVLSAEPVAVAESVTVAEPETIAEPVAMAESVAIAEPETIAEPAVMVESVTIAEPEPIEEPAAMAESVAIAEPEAVAEPVRTSETIAETVEVAEPVLETSEPVAQVAPDPVEEHAAESAREAVIEPVDDDVVIEPVAALAVVPDLTFQAPVDAVAEVQQISRKVAITTSLERLLGQVQARRKQLMAQSVA